MIFKDKFKKAADIISPEINRLLKLAWEKQNHKGDLLILCVNGEFKEEVLSYNMLEQKSNPYVIGLGIIGHSEQTHYSFINKYRSLNISELSHEEYLKQLERSPEKRQQIDEWTKNESHTIQLEMLIYLKFWEADLIIKKFYQLVRLIHKEPYDWYFKILESSRDKDSTGTRQDIIRLEIRERLKEIYPILYKVIKDTYKTQIRNSIAHSNYSFLDREISLNNLIKQDLHSQLHGISFDEWIDIFHNTLVLHNEYIRMNNVIKDHYETFALKNNTYIDIMITERDDKQYTLPLEYKKIWGDWSYVQN